MFLYTSVISIDGSTGSFCGSGNKVLIKLSLLFVFCRLHCDNVKRIIKHQRPSHLPKSRYHVSGLYRNPITSTPVSTWCHSQHNCVAWWALAAFFSRKHMCIKLNDIFGYYLFETASTCWVGYRLIGCGRSWQAVNAAFAWRFIRRAVSVFGFSFGPVDVIASYALIVISRRMLTPYRTVLDALAHPWVGFPPPTTA